MLRHDGLEVREKALDAQHAQNPKHAEDLDEVELPHLGGNIPRGEGEEDGDDRDKVHT